MMTAHPTESGAPVLGLAATSNQSMMEQTTAALAALAGARTAFLERLTTEPGVVEVVAAVGPDAPPLGRCPARPPGSSPDVLVRPLTIDGRPCGTLVAVGVAPGTATDPALAAQLELLSCTASLALRNEELERELKAGAAAASERHYRLICGTAHHLRDVLGVASAYTQLMDTESALTPRQQEYVAASRRNVDTAVRLISELLDLGRVETGRMPVEWGRIEVRSVIRGMLTDYERTKATRGITFETRLAEALPFIYSDVDLLRRVLDTLLSNSFRYAPDGSTVTVGAWLRSGRRAGDPSAWICISVSDRGPGVAQHDDVFEEVERVESTVSPGFRLAIARRLARLLGGDLTLDTSLGPGSTFTLWLPTETGATGQLPRG